MAAINLKVPVEIIIKDGDKEETIKVEIAELTKKQSKELKEKMKEFEDISYRLDRLSSKLESAKKKAEYAEKLQDYKKAMQMQEKADEIENELEQILKKFKELGGEEFFEKQAQKTFEKIVSGEGKARLKEIGEIKSFTYLMELLRQAKDEELGKELKE